MKLIITSSIIISLGVLLLLQYPIAKSFYKYGFFLGIATVAYIAFTQSSFTIYLSLSNGHSFFRFAGLLLSYVPFVILIESGLLGYRAFGSWMRYFSFAVAIAGGIGVLASSVMSRFLTK
jgi:hypothetical protein